MIGDTHPITDDRHAATGLLGLRHSHRPSGGIPGESSRSTAYDSAEPSRPHPLTEAHTAASRDNLADQGGSMLRCSAPLARSAGATRCHLMAETARPELMRGIGGMSTVARMGDAVEL